MDTKAAGIQMILGAAEILEQHRSIAISHPTDALSGHQTSKATAIGKCCYK